MNALHAYTIIAKQLDVVLKSKEWLEIQPPSDNLSAVIAQSDGQIKAFRELLERVNETIMLRGSEATIPDWLAQRVAAVRW